MSLAFVAPAVRSAHAVPHATAVRPNGGPHAKASPAALLAVGAVAAAAARKPRATSFVGVRSTRCLRGARAVVCAAASFPEGRKLRVAVVGGGPAGASAADQLAKDGVETFLIERKWLGTSAHGPKS